MNRLDASVEADCFVLSAAIEWPYACNPAAVVHSK